MTPSIFMKATEKFKTEAPVQLFAFLIMTKRVAFILPRNWHSYDSCRFFAVSFGPKRRKEGGSEHPPPLLMSKH